MELTPEEKERWIEHMAKFKRCSGRYNPNKSTPDRYIFLVNELNRLGSIADVMRAHKVGRNTIHNAMRFVKRMERTEIPQGEDMKLSAPLEAL